MRQALKSADVDVGNFESMDSLHHIQLNKSAKYQTDKKNVKGPGGDWGQNDQPPYKILSKNTLEEPKNVPAESDNPFSFIKKTKKVIDPLKIPSVEQLRGDK